MEIIGCCQRANWWGKQSEMQMASIGLRQHRAALRIPNNWLKVCYLVEAVWQLILFFY